MKKLVMWSTMAALSAPLAMPQDAQKVTVPFRDASRPRKLVVDSLLGSVTVRGYEGQEAIVETTPRAGDGRGRGGGRGGGRGKQTEVPAGMHRIGGNTGGVEITEDNNTINISGGFFSPVDISIQVPTQTSVTVNLVTGRTLTIEDISGEVEATNMNGQVNINNVSGSVVAHSMNGKIMVSLNSVMPDKAVSVSTMNGDIDVSLPSAVKANLKLKTDHGGMFTDFDIKVDSTPRPPKVEDRRDKGGPYRVEMGGTTYGTINGGGPEIQFTTFNGNIRIHKK